MPQTVRSGSRAAHDEVSSGSVLVHASAGLRSRASQVVHRPPAAAAACGLLQRAHFSLSVGFAAGFTGALLLGGCSGLVRSNLNALHTPVPST